MDASIELRSDRLEVAYSLQNMTSSQIDVITRPAPEWDDGRRTVHEMVLTVQLMLSRSVSLTRPIEVLDDDEESGP
jgi:hypothetical protein